MQQLLLPQDELRLLRHQGLMCLGASGGCDLAARDLPAHLGHQMEKSGKHLRKAVIFPRSAAVVGHDMQVHRGCITHCADKHCSHGDVDASALLATCRQVAGKHCSTR